MAQPTTYAPTNDFSQQEAANAAGRSTVNTTALDAELANIETTLAQVLANLALLQRDDGKLADLATEIRTLSSEVLNLIGGFVLRGDWAAATVYAVKDIVINADYVYYCHTAHTSDITFDAQYWTKFGYSSGDDARQYAIAAQSSANDAAGHVSTAAVHASSAETAKTAAEAAKAGTEIAQAAAEARAIAADVSAVNAANSASAAEAAVGSLGIPVAVAKGGTGAATASDARANLGLGTAAVLNTGTSANNVVKLDGSAKLPAVDGSQLTNIALGATKTFPERRQSVLSAAIDSLGRASFLSAVSGQREVTLLATSVPFVAGIANGFSGNGAVDYYANISADVVSAWTGLTASATSYLYMERNPGTGAITYGATTPPPVYGPNYFAAMGNRTCSLLHFDGNATDENPEHVWTAVGNANFGGTGAFGSGALTLDGSGDWLKTKSLSVDAADGFKMECRFNPSNFSALRYILGGDNFSFAVGINTSGKLVVYLSSNGSSWNIASGVAGTTTITAANYHHLRFQYDGANYRVYLDGAQEINVASALLLDKTGNFYLGALNASNGFLGTIDEFLYQDGPQTLAAFTPPVAAYASAILDGAHWFDTTRYRMYERVAGVWVEKQRLFVGQATCDATQVTSLTAYALGGRYDSGWFWLDNVTPIVKNHNIGIDGALNYAWKVAARGNSAYLPAIMDGRPDYSYQWNGASNTAYYFGALLHSVGATALTVTAAHGGSGGNYVSPQTSTPATFGEAPAFTAGQVRVLIERAW